MDLRTSVVVLFCYHQAISSGVSTYDLQISPGHIRLAEERTEVAVTCSAGIPLDGCQFKWWDSYGGEGPTLDLTRGAESQPDPAHLSENLTNYTYSGRGLEQGDCGVVLQLEGWKAWMIACRVKTKNGSWSYKWTDLYAQGWQPLSSFVAPREAVAVPGGVAKFLMLTNASLGSCHYFLPETNRLVLDAGAAAPDATTDQRYYGLGLDRGECGLALRNVSDQQNGLFRVWVANGEQTAADTRLMALIVARPPSQNVSLTAHDDGNATTYTCVMDGRPLPATVTWTLGFEVIRQDGRNDHPGGGGDDWHWPWMDRRMEQRVTLKNAPGSEPRELRCSFSNLASWRPVAASVTIRTGGYIGD